jgi:predicted O-linked N-acetylglucosamine transferase (SPINDLY family)
MRGHHMPLYNDIDITLDTFPLTGGTTTVEALWMGAPVVSLRGEAYFERLSWSILANLGLEDMAADDLAGYRAIALSLAADRGRRAELRRTLRETIRSSPLGDTKGFARDFYALIENTVR